MFWKLVLSLSILVAFCLYIFVLRKPETIYYIIDSKTYTLRVAETQQQKSRGLSKIKKANGFDGMIFYFNPPEQATFWNKDTYLDLELIWIKNDNIIGRSTLPSIENGLTVKLAPEAVTEVIELIK